MYLIWKIQSIFRIQVDLKICRMIHPIPIHEPDIGFEVGRKCEHNNSISVYLLCLKLFKLSYHLNWVHHAYVHPTSALKSYQHLTWLLTISFYCVFQIKQRKAFYYKTQLLTLLCLVLSYDVSEFGHHNLMLWLVASLTPDHYINWCWPKIDWGLKTRFKNIWKKYQAYTFEQNRTEQKRSFLPQ